VTTLTIKLSGERMLRLREAAARYGVTPEELARVGIEDLLLQPEEDVQRTIEYVLRKNRELYQRLAH